LYLMTDGRRLRPAQPRMSDHDAALAELTERTQTFGLGRGCGAPPRGTEGAGCSQSASSLPRMRTHDEARGTARARETQKGVRVTTLPPLQNEVSAGWVEGGNAERKNRKHRDYDVPGDSRASGSNDRQKAKASKSVGRQVAGDSMLVQKLPSAMLRVSKRAFTGARSRIFRVHVAMAPNVLAIPETRFNSVVKLNVQQRASGIDPICS